MHSYRTATTLPGLKFPNSNFVTFPSLIAACLNIFDCANGICSLIFSSYSVSPFMYFVFFSKLYGRSNGLPELLKKLKTEKHLIGFVMTNSYVI